MIGFSFFPVSFNHNVYLNFIQMSSNFFFVVVRFGSVHHDWLDILFLSKELLLLFNNNNNNFKYRNENETYSIITFDFVQMKFLKSFRFVSFIHSFHTSRDLSLSFFFYFQLSYIFNSKNISFIQSFKILLKLKKQNKTKIK